jgi:hypothetical protein
MAALIEREQAKSEESRQTAAAEAGLLSAQSFRLVEEVQKIELGYNRLLLNKRAELKIKALRRSVFGNYMIGLGIWLAFFAQSIGKTGDPPDLPV